MRFATERGYPGATAQAAGGVDADDLVRPVAGAPDASVRMHGDRGHLPRTDAAVEDRHVRTDRVDVAAAVPPAEPDAAVRGGRDPVVARVGDGRPRAGARVHPDRRRRRRPDVAAPVRGDAVDADADVVERED